MKPATLSTALTALTSRKAHRTRRAHLSSVLASSVLVTACNLSGDWNEPVPSCGKSRCVPDNVHDDTQVSVSGTFAATPPSNTPADTTLSVEQKLEVIRHVMGRSAGDHALGPSEVLKDGHKAPENDKVVCTVSGHVSVAHNGQPIAPGQAFDVMQGQTSLTLDQCRYQLARAHDQTASSPVQGSEGGEGVTQNDGQISLSHTIDGAMFTQHTTSQNFRVSRIRDGQPQLVQTSTCMAHVRSQVKPEPRKSVVKLTTLEPGCQWRDELTGQTVEIERSAIRTANAADVKDESGQPTQPVDGTFFAAEQDAQFRLGGGSYTIEGTILRTYQAPSQSSGVWEFKTATGQLVGRVYLHGDSRLTLMVEPAGGEAVPLYLDESQVTSAAAAQ